MRIIGTNFIPAFILGFLMMGSMSKAMSNWPEDDFKLLNETATSVGVASIPAGAVPPSRDGNIAIREEYEIAASQGTIEGFELFIRRHPEHPLADEARRQIELLRQHDCQ